MDHYVSEAVNATEEIQDRLRDIGRFMDEADSQVMIFASLLADRLPENIMPEGFTITAEFLIYDLQTGIDSFNSLQLHGSLVGLSPRLYDKLRIAVPRLAEAVCPPEFAQRVKQIMDETNQMD